MWSQARTDHNALNLLDCAYMNVDPFPLESKLGIFAWSIPYTL